MSTAAAIVISTALVVIGVIVTLVFVGRRPQSTPIGSEIGDLRQNIGRMLQSMEHLGESHDDVRATVEVLMSNPGKRGVWGELTLLRLLENAGLKLGVDFEEQVTLDAGRPDIVIHLGDGGEIVIDSKAPIVHLKTAWETEDEDERKTAIKAFADGVRTYARDLAKRDYASQLRTTFAPVVMYIPVDGAWEAAREMRPDILSEMLQIGIYPAEPSTMGMTLRILKQHATNSRQEEAVRAVLEDARTVLDKVRIHVDHLNKLGGNLGKTVESFDKAVGNLDRGILPAGRRMAEHVDARIGDVEKVGKGPDLDRVERLIEKTEVD